MSELHYRWLHAAATTVLLTVTAGAADKFHAVPTHEDVRSQTMGWITERNVTDASVLGAVDAIWSDVGDPVSPSDLLDSVVESFAAVDEDVADFVAECALPAQALVPPSFQFDEESHPSEFLLANLRFFYGKHLCLRSMYEEAYEVFLKVRIEAMIDPASYLFYRAVCEHQLLKRDEGLETIDELLTNTEDIPSRYRTVATLMQHDLESLKPESLDEISRKMSDVERRLQLGRGGQKVQRVEEEIIAGLDEIIEKIEQQQGQSSSSNSGQGGNQNNPSNPAQDSTIKGETAPGEVDESDIGSQQGWGALPPKDQARAKNEINRNYPAHYQDAIEQYLKKLAKRRSSSPGN